MPAIAAGVGRTTGVTRPATPPAPDGAAVVEVVEAVEAESDSAAASDSDA